MSFSGAVIGIDFGTVECVISQAKRGGIDTVLNEASRRKTACFVSFQGNQRFIGDAAAPLVKSNFRNTIRNVKRVIGRKFKDVQDELNLMPNKDNFIELPNGDVGIKVEYNDEEKIFTCEQITAMMLNRLRATVNKKDLPSDVVISVPGWWNEKQRRAMMDACHIAGFKPLRLLNDHTSAALSYGIYKSARNVFDVSEKQIVMFIDIGFSNMSVAIVGFVQGKLEVMSAAFEPNLGGRDFDLLIFNKMADEFKAKHDLDVRSNAKATLKLLEACEKAKQTMTPEGVNLAKVQVEFLMEEIDFKSELKLEDFEEMSAPLLAKLQRPLDEALAAAKLTSEQLGSIEIIGGGTRPKIVKAALSKFLKLDAAALNYGLSTTLNLDESVARGCALNSAMLSPVFRVKEFNIFDTVLYPITLTWDQADSLPAAPESEVAEQNEDAVDASAENSNSVTILQPSQLTPCTKRVTFRRGKDFEITAKYELGIDSPARTYVPSGFDPNLAKFKVVVTNAKQQKEDKLPLIRVDFKHDKSCLFDLISAEALHEMEAEPEPVKAAPEAKEETENKEDNSEGAEKAKEESEEKKAEEKKPAKKKYKKEKLQVIANFVYGLPSKKLEQFATDEKTFMARDKVLEETAEAKNELEAYIYAYRDKVDLSLKEFVTPEEKDKFGTKLSEEENWLYDEGFDVKKEEYVKRLGDLKLLGDRFDTRESEFNNRPGAISTLKESIRKFTEVVNSTEEHLDHITEEEREKVRKAMKETEEWLHLQVSGQEKLSKSDDPVLTSSMVVEQGEKLGRVANPVINKRRPPPPKKEKEPEKKEEEKMEDTEKKEESENQTEEHPPSDEKNEPDISMEVD